MSVEQQPFYLPVNGGRRFCVWRAPRAPDPMRGVVLHVPAFAEEMNKSRRMTAWAARELASRGFGVLQIDLLGCGDSSGDFGDATWNDWVDDIVAASAWIRAQCNGPLWLWGLRAGALLATAALPLVGSKPSLLLWQPVLSGRHYLTQFLRLKLAAGLSDERRDSGGTEALREALRQGRPIEVAGYRLSPALAAGLDAAELALTAANVGRVVWIEVTGAEPPALLPASQSRISGLHAQEMQVSATAVRGPGFWQTLEIEDCSDLIDASVIALHSEGERELSRDPALL